MSIVDITDLVAKLDALRKASMNDYTDSDDGVECLLAFEESWPELRRIVVAAQAYVEAFSVRRGMDKEGGYSSVAYMEAFAAERETRDRLVAAVRGEA